MFDFKRIYSSTSHLMDLHRNSKNSKPGWKGSSCWYCPPPGNKITDAGVLLDTLRQHQDIVIRKEPPLIIQSISEPQWRATEKKRRRGVDGGEEAERWTDGGSIQMEEGDCISSQPAVGCPLSLPSSLLYAV